MKIFYADWLGRLFELLAFEALMGPCTTCLFEAILTFSLLRPGLKIMLVHDCQNVAGKFKQERYASFTKPSMYKHHFRAQYMPRFHLPSAWHPTPLPRTVRRFHSLLRQLLSSLPFWECSFLCSSIWWLVFASDILALHHESSTITEQIASSSFIFKFSAVS